MSTPENPILIGMTRRHFLRLSGPALAGLTAFGLSCAPDRSQPPIPTTKPTIAPTEVPTPEPLDARIAENLQKELLNLAN
ncbi:MAG: hypothetical protein NUV73_00680 [Candidatus Daviesbacteria bacterium]|nr:hypothetical protein [Candidatus Daviesbacteria bacterium]